MNRWRPMRAGDVEPAAQLGNAVHLAYPEDPIVFRDRLNLHPFGCFVLDDGERLSGYLLSHPWARASLPPINAALERLPASPDCYYLHDLALIESVRGQGHALVALDLAIAETRACGLDTILLMAVGEAHGYWERAGFEAWPDYRPDPAKGYGDEAQAYVRYV